MLGKRWFAMRHGHSLANEQGIIASRVETAIGAYGLTNTGSEEVRRSVQEMKPEILAYPPVVIYTSPLLRTRQSAMIASNILNCSVFVDERLTERDFGSLELTSDQSYHAVWSQDAVSDMHSQWGVENLQSVMNRVGNFIEDIEGKVDVQTVVLITHGDVAAMLICAFCNIDPKIHRSLPHLKTAEIRS